MYKYADFHHSTPLNVKQDRFRKKRDSEHVAESGITYSMLNIGTPNPFSKRDTLLFDTLMIQINSTHL